MLVYRPLPAIWLLNTYANTLQWSLDSSRFYDIFINKLNVSPHWYSWAVSLFVWFSAWRLAHTPHPCLLHIIQHRSLNESFIISRHHSEDHEISLLQRQTIVVPWNSKGASWYPACGQSKALIRDKDSVTCASYGHRVLSLSTLWIGDRLEDDTEKSV